MDCTPTIRSLPRACRVLFTLGVAAALGCGCSNTKSGEAGGGGGGGGTKFVSVGTSPPGGAFPVVGADIAEVLNKHRGDNTYGKVQVKGTKGSQENIRRLVKNELQLALSNSAISYYAVRGESSWDDKFDIRAVTTIAPNVAMFITKEDSGIRTIADLKGKTVICGPAGAGFEMFITPILEEHGLSYDDDITARNAPQGDAVEQLGDGTVDAAFLGGAVPTGSIQQACSSHEIHFIPFDDDAKQRLIEKYPFFQPVTIPQTIYKGLDGDFQGLNVGSMHLITSAGESEEQVFQLTKVLYENRDSMTHPAKKFINEDNAARYTGTEFHPGAVKFYKEIGIWKDAAIGGKTAAKTAEPKTAAKTQE